MERGKHPEAKLPSAFQAGIDPDTYAKLSETPWCARLGQECSSVCQPLERDGRYKVELDHIVPRSKGGNDAIDNLQWLCACENKRKYNKPDARYSGELYFDQEVNLGNLREHQRELAYMKAVGEYRELFESPQALLSRFMLLAWLMGAGKTVGMCATLFGINHARKKSNGESCRRIRRVLWLVHQRSLVESIANELETELTKYGIVKRNPKVIQVKNSGHWGWNADIVVACPQALWDVEGRKLSPEMRAEILSKFDAIVVDEAQFGIDHYLDIAQLAPTAFKFAVTATPMDKNGTMFHEIDNGKYRDYFVLFSSFGYEKGYDNGFYKKILPFEEGFGKTYCEIDGGSAVIQRGLSTEDEENTDKISLIRAKAVIEYCRNLAKAIDAKTNYNTHVMIRVGSISRAKAILKSFGKEGDLCGVWTGSPRPLLGSDEHPWMLAKGNDGMLVADSKKIVVRVDIGQVGINNPYCGIFAWLEAGSSVPEDIQNLGRSIRLRRGQTCVDMHLVWDAAQKHMIKHVPRLIDYVLNMNRYLEGFPTMSDLSLEVPGEIEVDLAPRIVKGSDRVAIASWMGEEMINGVSIESAKTSAVDRFKLENPTLSSRYIEKVEKYADMLTTTEGRSAVLGLPDIYEQGIPFVVKEGAPSDYSRERVVGAIEQRLILTYLPDNELEEVIENIDLPPVRSMAIDALKQFDNSNRNIDDLPYYDPAMIIGNRNGRSKSKSKEKLPFKSLMAQIVELMDKALSDRDLNKANRDLQIKGISQELNETIRALFGFGTKMEYQPFEKQFSDCLMRQNVQRYIVKRCYADIIKKRGHLFPGLKEVFGTELKDFNETEEE